MTVLIIVGAVAGVTWPPLLANIDMKNYYRAIRSKKNQKHQYTWSGWVLTILWVFCYLAIAAAIPLVLMSVPSYAVDLSRYLLAALGLMFAHISFVHLWYIMFFARIHEFAGRVMAFIMAIGAELTGGVVLGLLFYIGGTYCYAAAALYIAAWVVHILLTIITGTWAFGIVDPGKPLLGGESESDL